MLVVSRKASESIRIGDEIEVIITEIGSDRVKIGIQAPKGVPILRKELWETKKLNQEANFSSDVGAIQKLNSYLGTLGKEGQTVDKK